MAAATPAWYIHKKPHPENDKFIRSGKLLTIVILNSANGLLFTTLHPRQKQLASNSTNRTQRRTGIGWIASQREKSPTKAVIRWFTVDIAAKHLLKHIKHSNSKENYGKLRVVIQCPCIWAGIQHVFFLQRRLFNYFSFLLLHFCQLPHALYYTSINK